MKEKADEFARVFDHLNSGLNELLTYMGDELSGGNPGRREDSEFHSEAISVYDANFFDKPRIIIAINNTVKKLSEDDIALMKDFDILYEHCRAFVDGGEVVTKIIQGLIVGMLPTSPGGEAENVIKPSEVQSIIDQIIETPISRYSFMILKAENILHKLNRLLDRYYR